MKIDVLMLTIVPLPNLQIDEVNILFDMEVKQSEKEESPMDLGASITGTLNLGIVKVSVTGNVSAHSSNTRSSDNSAKYHVDVMTTNHSTPEGLAREISQIEARLSRAGDGLDNYIQQMKKLATTQLNVYQAEMMRLTNILKKDVEADQEKEYVLYIGLNDKDTYEQCIETEEVKGLACAICIQYVDGHTLMVAIFFRQLGSITWNTCFKGFLLSLVLSIIFVPALLLLGCLYHSS